MSCTLSKTQELVAEVEEAGIAWIAPDTVGTDIKVRLPNAVTMFSRIEAVIKNAGYRLGGALEYLRPRWHCQYVRQGLLADDING